jgi:hypothetical protein
MHLANTPTSTSPPTPLYKRMDISHLARERQNASQQAAFRVIGSVKKVG